ncbi:hypothetical protein JOB18_021618 [Solea senegalensis]|uniref:Uncharacterized protein n=1 Tax=Solea senegalensis TaxID=28829 RepID=A0AAV6PL67_SOLSE|nr:hypothetical protein JOB18_021618 [Solea senegalensis]
MTILHDGRERDSRKTEELTSDLCERNVASAARDEEKRERQTERQMPRPGLGPALLSGLPGCLCDTVIHAVFSSLLPG